jgi:molybdate transport system ATP-binding protein
LPDFPHHRITVQHDAHPRLDIRFDLTAPWTVLFGPSGSGKSTILRALCGLLPASQAQIQFERRNTTGITDLTTHATHRRDLSYAPQDTALFPHLTVAENISFPMQVCAEPLRSTEQVEAATALFHLHTLADRKPSELSGGEARRVALARAFATPGTKLMLLDEPFTGLDRKLRDELLPEMQQWLAAHNIPALSVTHDVDETLLLNAEVLRLDEGRITAQGPAHEVLAAERDRLLAALNTAN